MKVEKNSEYNIITGDIITADTIDKIVAQNLKKRRIRLRLSQRDIAKTIGVSIQQVQKYENAINRISSGKLFYIANLLKLPINRFFIK